MSAIHISQEVIESQKSRSELLKWKIIVVSILATVGLGVSKDIEKLELAFCLIPLVCGYVDALCLHLNLRIFSIGKWHKLDVGKNLNSEFVYMQHYEEFIQRAYECGAYRLEKLTILFSSLIINILIAVVPYLNIAELNIINKKTVSSFGVFGIIVTIALNTYLQRTKARIDAITPARVVKNISRETE